MRQGRQNTNKTQLSIHEGRNMQSAAKHLEQRDNLVSRLRMKRVDEEQARLFRLRTELERRAKGGDV